MRISVRRNPGLVGRSSSISSLNVSYSIIALEGKDLNFYFIFIEFFSKLLNVNCIQDTGHRRHSDPNTTLSNLW